MEFLKTMKSREMKEMALKTIMMVMVGLVLIILMEGMIYSIYMNKIKAKPEITQFTQSECIAYCEKIDDDEYKIYQYNTEDDSWGIEKVTKSKTAIEGTGYKKVVYGKPNAFDVSITGNHYIVMAVFIAGILGFYGWRFYRLNKDYKQLEKKFKKTGKIFA